MRTILQEIKKFRKLINLNEDFNSDVKSVIIGDGLVKYLENEDFSQIKNLVDDNMTVNKLLNRLNDESEYIDVDHVFLSIGANDKFSSDEEISFLVNKIKDVFPNATLQVIKGIVDEDYFYGGEEESDFQTLEDESTYFYDLFFKDGVEVLGNYDTVNYGLGYGDPKILQIKKEMANSLFKNETDQEIDSEPQKVDIPFLKKNNKDISGGDATDFDTIYEFLNRFSEIVKSENYYDSRTSSSFKPDIEQIQIVLMFLIPSLDLDITGKFDTATQEAVVEYQESQNMDPTGICDTETLEEMFYDLKIKGFDDRDLGMFLLDMGINTNVVKVKRFTGSVDSVWKEFTDKIIDNFEGGYWNNDRTKGPLDKCIKHPYISMYDNSGETMMGIDRRAGEWDKTPEGRAFFQLIDDEKEEAGNMVEFCKTWEYLYLGGSLRDELKSRAGDLMLSSYNKNSKYFSKEAKEEVESDKRLLFHFAYACWNGPGFFQEFANDINKAVRNGYSGDDLVDVAIDSRNRSFQGTSWEDGNSKVTNILKTDTSLQ